MKTKLLRIVRRKYRIIENGLGHRYIEKKHWYGWRGLSTGDAYTIAVDRSIRPTQIKDVRLDLLGLISSKYYKYRLRYKTRQYKLKQTKTIWYK